jgi:hypothetical protein
VLFQWNSTFTMMYTLLRVKNGLTLACANLGTEMEEKLPLPAQWEQINHLVCLLFPFYQVTVKWQEAKHLSISTMPLFWSSTCEAVEAAGPFVPAVASVQRTLIASMKARNEYDNAFYRKVTALDPRFKELTWLPQIQRDELKRALKNEIALLRPPALPPPPPPAPPAPLPLPAAPANSLIPDVFKNIGKRMVAHGVEMPALPPPAPIDEVDEYFGFNLKVSQYHTDAAQLIDPLAWWLTHKDSFPLLSTLARRYLAIPATAAQAERVWSTAGRIATDRRAMLRTGSIAEQTFLSINHRLLPRL